MQVDFRDRIKEIQLANNQLSLVDSWERQEKDSINEDYLDVLVPPFEHPRQHEKTNEF